MLARRVFFLAAAITTVSVIPFFLNLTEYKRLLAADERGWLGRDRSLLVVEVYPKDPNREARSERGRGGDINIHGDDQSVKLGAAQNASKNQETLASEPVQSSLQERTHNLVASRPLKQNGLLSSPVDSDMGDSSLKQQVDKSANRTLLHEHDLETQPPVRSHMTDRPSQEHKTEKAAYVSQSEQVHDLLASEITKQEDSNKPPVESHVTEKPPQEHKTEKAAHISQSEQIHDLLASETPKQGDSNGAAPVESHVTDRPSQEQLGHKTEKVVHISESKQASDLLVSDNQRQQEEGSNTPPVESTAEKLHESQEPLHHTRRVSIEAVTVAAQGRQAVQHKEKDTNSRAPVDPTAQKPLNSREQLSHKSTGNQMSNRVVSPSVATLERRVGQVRKRSEWQPINQKHYKLNRTLHVNFPKIDMLYSATPCTLKNVTYNPVETPRGEEEIRELKLVEQNLEKCLEAAELTDYFEKQSYTSTAKRNAARFILRIREVVPASYSANHGKVSCWKSKYRLTLCSGRMVEGHVSHHPFSFDGHLLTPELQHTVYFGGAGRVSSPAMCLPSVFVAGFPKCGSSFVYCLIQRLYQYKKWKFLLQQPEKEPHFWVPGGPVYHHHYPHDLGDMARYLLNFLPRAVGNNSFSIPIDASPNTMFQWPRYAHNESLENYCLVPSVLPVVLPRTKYIVVLRDPVTMLYSAFWFSISTHCKSLNRTEQVQAPDDFHHRVLKKIKSYTLCSRFRPVDACMESIYPPISGPVAYGSSECGRVRLEVGFYYYYIRRWLATIPREQFHFMTMEEMKKDYRGASQDLSDFLDLGLDMVRRPYVIVNDETCKNVQSKFNYRNDTQLQMRNDTKRLLYDFFDPINQKLADLLQDSKFHWKPQE